MSKFMNRQRRTALEDMNVMEMETEGYYLKESHLFADNYSGYEAEHCPLLLRKLTGCAYVQFGGSGARKNL